MSVSEAMARSRLSRRITSSYDAAQPGGDNAAYWGAADGLGPVSSNDPHTRKGLRERARYETDNDSAIAGILDTVANDTIGPGPSVNVTVADDPGFAEDIEAKWREWCCWVGGFGLTQMLILTRKDEIKSGELLWRFRRTADHEVGLDIEIFECDRLTNPNAFDPLDGIDIGPDRQPRRYHILKQHPGDAVFMGESMIEAEWVPADQIIHTFKRLRPGQRRGIPELTPSLNRLAERRRYMAAVLAAAESAANIPYAFTTPGFYTDDEGNEEKIHAMEEVEAWSRTVPLLPDGWGLSAPPPSHPHTNHVDYTMRLLVEAVRPLNVPANVALGDSSDYSYASGRLDMQMYDRACRVERLRFERTILDRVFNKWLAFAIARGVVKYPMADIVDPAKVARTWIWTNRPHVEPLKEANAQKVRLENRTSNLSIECAHDGRDWREVLDQQKREQDYRDEIGLRTEPATAIIEDEDEEEENGKPAARNAAPRG